MTLLALLDYLGVFVFALSGAIVAVRKEMDIFGLLVLAMMPAVGGGTLRDLLLDVPVFWMQNPVYLLLILIAALGTYFGHRLLDHVVRPLAWADAVGLAVFCVLGAEKSLSFGASVPVAIVLGVATAVAGGIIRDVIANEVPYVLQREIYATAALIGCCGYIVLTQLQVPQAEWLAMLLALTARGLGIVKGLSLPPARPSQD